MYSVYQHWDPLRVCVVGRSYPPEFYSWIKIPRVRELFERIARETEEDYQSIIHKLESFGVNVIRPNLYPAQFNQGNKLLPPPMTPRDHMIMIGDTFYTDFKSSFVTSYNNIRDSSWPNCFSWEEFDQLPQNIQQECNSVFKFDELRLTDHSHYAYNNIVEQVRQQGNNIKYVSHEYSINGAMISRIGQDLYFGTRESGVDIDLLKQTVNSEFKHTRNHIVDTGGHSDSTYCPVAPGLIISLHDVPCYKDTFPGWEVIYLPGQSWDKVSAFLDLKIKNQGRWWIPGFEYDQSVIDVVETWLNHWVGYVEETVFDVNMLIIDPKNVMVFNYNKQVFDALDRYGITPHIVTFRHRYFWDGGIHCVTSDLHREGVMQDYFPNRS
jgi:hypothetical protein